MWGEATIDGRRYSAANDSQALGCYHRFAGQYYDEESELHYKRFRYYSPETGQYLSHDPIGLQGGFNPYGYVFDPTGWVDVLGLKPKIPPFDAPSLESDAVRYKPRDVLTATAGSREDAINLAWSQEKQLIQQTGRGTRPWTPEEMALITSTPDSELLSVMSKEGYTGHHITSVRNGPLGAKWQGDPRNIVFLENRNHPNGDAHQYSYQGHRGNYSNPTTGRLIDREETLKQRLNQIQSKCTG